MTLKIQAGQTVVLNTGEILEIVRFKVSSVLLIDSNLNKRELSRDKLIKNKIKWTHPNARKYNLEIDPTRFRSEFDGFYNVMFLDYENLEATIKFDNSYNTKTVDIFTALNGLAQDRYVLPEYAEEHYVYAAYYNEVIYYIGQGKETRYKHVNSGTSHNYDLNWHHFNNYDFEIKIIKDQLTKEQAIELEDELIKRHQPRCNKANK